MDWYIDEAGEAAGPFSADEVANRLREMQEPGTLVWRDGLEGWEPAGQQPEFLALFPKRPPPLPSRTSPLVLSATPPPLPDAAGTSPVDSLTDEPFELAPADPVVPGSPWSRYFARQIDILYLGFGSVVALSFALAAYAPAAFRSFNSMNAGLLGVVALAMAMVLNALVISIFGNSLGKKVFGLLAVPHDIRNQPGPLWIFAREFRVWLYGLAVGFPLVAIWTASRNHTEVKAGRPAHYDRDLAAVLETPISGARRAGGMIFALALIIASFGADIWGRSEESRTARAKPWVNPVTMLTAQVPGGWNIDAANSNPAEKLYGFSTGDGMEAAFLASESIDAAILGRFDVERYAMALEQSLAETMEFRGRWVPSNLGGRAVLVRDAVLKGEGWPASYAIWQEGSTFWRVMALSAIKTSPPNVTEMPVAVALAASVPKQQ